jgi:Icc-related predicted phosphoesterase
LHRELDVPPGDMLIHAGDFTVFSERPSIVLDFDQWLGELPHRHKIVVPGNHDFLMNKIPNRRLITNATLLVDSGVEVEGLRIWGSPATKLYGATLGRADTAERKGLLPPLPDIHILVTHGPPHGILDVAPDSNVHAGCPELLEQVLSINPKLHVFGHIHGCYGTHNLNGTLFVNASLFGKAGGLNHQPIVVDI